MSGLYIHIPFCASRCIYCDFYSSTQSHLQDDYVNALCQEIDLLENKPSIGTIYLGGGTPSQLSHENLVKLFNHIYQNFEVSIDAEITMECNPDDVVPTLLKDTPINRVSMGAQTFSDERLRFLRRRHSASEVDRAVEILRAQNIKNISIDLIFGFPDENLQDWNDDITHVLSLHPEHISAYGLIYEEGTALYKLLAQGKIEEIDEDLSLEMYKQLIDRLTSAGYEHYEISNFAKPGYRSRHNSSYWQNIPYIGLGTAAHSYDMKTRRWNVANIKKYIESIHQGILPYEEEVLDDDTKLNDLVSTALRTKEGICIKQLNEQDALFLMENARPYIEKGLLLYTEGRLHLSMEGIFISNTIMSDLMKT